MTEGMTREQILETIREEIATQRAAAEAERDPVERDRILRHAQIREDVAEDEAEAIEAEIAENQQSALSLRVPTSLVNKLKARAEAEHIPTSALVRRLLTEAIERHPSASALTAEQIEQVEEIARRVYRESA